MKELIAFCAVFILLLTFPMQYALNMKNHYTMSIVQKHVSNAKERSRLEGCFTDDIVADLKSKIEADTSIDSSEVSLDSETLNAAMPRGALIHYKVSVPIKRFIAAGGFWNVSDEMNSGLYVIEGYSVSEWIER